MVTFKDLTVFLLCLLLSVYGEEPSQDCQNRAKGITKEIKDEDFVKFCKECIEKPYGFKASDDMKMWKKPLPNFENDLKKGSFIKIAEGAEKFFKKETGGKTRDWDQLKSEYKYKFMYGACQNMLHIVAARQLYVTYVITKVGPQDIKLCETQGNKGEEQFIIPTSACFPRNPGSARCSSDYDVSLIGPKAGGIVSDYWKYFKKTFGMSSEALFDNNLYAFSLEMALPELFVAGDSPGKIQKEHAEFLKWLESKRKNTADHQMQDIALAYFKVFMYNKDENARLIKQAKDCLAKEPYQGALKSWFNKLKAVKREYENNQKKLEDGTKSEEEINAELTRKYAWYSSSTNSPGHKKYNARVYTALGGIYASESYLTKGAIRVIVGSQQMENRLITKELTPLDHWASALENYGDVWKEYDRACKNDKTNLYACLLKLSKYMWRTFTSIKVLLDAFKNAKPGELNKSIKAECTIKDFKDEDDQQGNAVKRFTEASPSAVDITNSWIKCFKDRGESEIAKEYSDKECPNANLGKEKKNWAEQILGKVFKCKFDSRKLDATCMESLSQLIRAVNNRMLAVTNEKKIYEKNLVS